MNLFKYTTGIFCLLLIFGCEEIPDPEQPGIINEVPDDRLAFYVVEDLPEEMMYKKLPVDSIRFFGERFIEYEEILSYDTVYFTFEIMETAIDRVAAINNKYSKWCLPYAVVCEGEVIMGAYLYHPLSSCFPYWYYSTAIRQKNFAVYAPVWTEIPIKVDPRKDPRLIQVLSEDRKIKEPEVID
jgi:hypothetical protein